MGPWWRGFWGAGCGLGAEGAEGGASRSQSGAAGREDLSDGRGKEWGWLMDQNLLGASSTQNNCWKLLHML